MAYFRVDLLKCKRIRVFLVNFFKNFLNKSAYYLEERFRPGLVDALFNYLRQNKKNVYRSLHSSNLASTDQVRNIGDPNGKEQKV